MTDGLFSSVELGHAARAGYRLQHLEVFNWGTFDRQVWRLTPGADTALLTGDIGSGKSTLVDALTTLLMPAHKISYNKAAGAEARERTLRSYVEGHYKSERSEATGTSKAVGLRSAAKTYSVIVGVFVNDGYDETVTLAQVFQQRESTGQPYRFYVTATKQLTVADDFADFGSDLRDLRRRLRDAGSEVFDDFPKYSTSLRRLLGIRSPQALELFHQTVSMKSVGNLNDFVRDHMLEPADPGDRVREIIDHFDDLTKAHDAVIRAREQLEALGPIVATTAKHDAALAERAQLEGQRAGVRLFVAELRARLLGDEIEVLRDEVGRLQTEHDDAAQLKQRLAGERDGLIEERARAGGDRIGELQRLAREAREESERRQARRVSFDDAVRDAGLDPVDSLTRFAEITGSAESLTARLGDDKRGLDARYAELLGQARDVDTQRTLVRAELDSLLQRTSNLPTEQVELRDQLCTDLGLTPEQLPYAGELIDVADEHADWRGAAERVLRGFALTLLVPQEHHPAVTGWVNGRRLTATGRGGRQVGARLVFERVPDRRVALQRPSIDGLLLVDCLEVKDGAFRDHLRHELTKRADHRCADTLEQFRAERRAVTREGQVRSGERHEKDDRHRVDDPRRWVLGWANERKVTALQRELGDLDERHARLTSDAQTMSEERDAVLDRLTALAKVSAYDSWADLDWQDALTRAEQADAERERLTSGSPRLHEIEESLRRVGEGIAKVESNLTSIAGRVATRTAEIERAERDRGRDQELVSGQSGEVLEQVRATYDALTERLGARLPKRSADCAAAGEELTDELLRRIDRLGKEIGGYITSLTTAMSEVLRRWPELRSDLDASVESRREFLALHERVAQDDLPRFESEFKSQLNTNTIRELAQFNQWLRRQAVEIDDRIGLINQALGAIAYNQGRYIRLEKQQTTNQDVAAFRADLRNATDDTLGDDDHYSEQRFLEVKRIIERFRGREGYVDSDKAWTKRVTDVRNWFVFSASERDEETHEEWEHYSDSDGKSGGQKEKLAYTILAASLAYQFGLEWGVTKSRDFRFAVIDEAFGRGSDVSTRYALDLFAKLGLQLLIVTPLQKVRVIEPYVQAIGYVDNPDGTRSRLQTMTIEEYRERRDGPRP